MFLCLSSIAVLVVIVLALRFIPIDSRTGYLDDGIDNLCSPYVQPVNHNFRWVKGEVPAWDDELSHLREAKLSDGNPTCSEPAHVHLYVL